MKRLSQRTLVRMMEVLTAARPRNFSRLLYEHDFPDWFVAQADTGYRFDWDAILVELRNGTFFFPRYNYSSSSQTIWGEYLSKVDSRDLGDRFVEKLAALSTMFPESESVVNALQLDGFSVDQEKLRLVPLETPVSAHVEEDALTALVTDAKTILKHMADADSLYIDKKYHPSLNESRNFLQSLIDNVAGDTHKSGAHLVGFPGGTANRIDYLHAVSFLTAEEMAAVKSAWGALSAGSHPGVPPREEARIGLILALEFGQILLLKFEDWKSSGYKKFSR